MTGTISSFSDHATVTGQGNGSKGTICSSSVENTSLATVHPRKSSKISTPRCALIRSPWHAPSWNRSRASGERFRRLPALVTASFLAARHPTPRSHLAQTHTLLLHGRAEPIRSPNSRPSNGRPDAGVEVLARRGSAPPSQRDPPRSLAASALGSASVAGSRRRMHLVISRNDGYHVLPCPARPSPAVQKHQRRLVGGHEEV
ncbi:hypothetical protein TM48_00405 [Mycobacterium shottsii]|nr:hypothetical protein TM48_00405 [Mycobacterium shottsii]